MNMLIGAKLSLKVGIMNAMNIKYKTQGIRLFDKPHPMILVRINRIILD